MCNFAKQMLKMRNMFNKYSGHKCLKVRNQLRIIIIIWIENTVVYVIWKNQFSIVSDVTEIYPVLHCKGMEIVQRFCLVVDPHVSGFYVLINIVTNELKSIAIKNWGTILRTVLL